MKKYPAVFRDILWYRENISCLSACPVNTDSGKYVQLIAQKKYQEAFFIARSPNPLASICGRICAAPCVVACRRGAIDKPVTIRPLKRFLTEKFGVESDNPDVSNELLNNADDIGCHRSWHLSEVRNQDFGQTDKSVAIIGAGPAGISAAYYLRIMGYKVDIYEQRDQYGGMLRWGIPEYRLPKKLLKQEIDAILALGVNIHYGKSLGNNLKFEQLKQQHDAIFITIGAQNSSSMRAPGEEKNGVLGGIDFLESFARNEKIETGADVVVVGGGDTAIDAVRTARRLNADGNVTLLVYRRTREEMPAVAHEVEEAEKEGVQFKFLSAPVEIEGENEVTALRCQKMKLGEPDQSGRRRPIPIKGEFETIKASLVISAIGQVVDAESLGTIDGRKLNLTDWNTIQVKNEETLQTNLEAVFAGGDAVRGPSTVIEAVGDGIRAADSINKYLSQDQPATSVQVQIEKIPKDEYEMIRGYEKFKYSFPKTIEAEKRTNTAEVEKVYDEQEAIEQAQRCLVCHVDTIYDAELCVLCGRCSDVCPQKCLKFVPLEEVDIPENQQTAIPEHSAGEPLTVLLKDDTDCIRCGLCAIRCPTEAMTMEKFNFIESVL